jgi:hypothetical protein
MSTADWVIVIVVLGGWFLFAVNDGQFRAAVKKNPQGFLLLVGLLILGTFVFWE